MGFLTSKAVLVAAGSVVTVTLTGAGGYLTGFGSHKPPAPQVRVAARPTVAVVHDRTVIRERVPVVVRETSTSAAAASRRTIISRTRVVAVAPSPSPSRCTLPPGLCRTRQRPSGARR